MCRHVDKVAGYRNRVVIKVFVLSGEVGIRGVGTGGECHFVSDWGVLTVLRVCRWNLEMVQGTATSGIL